MLEYDGHCSRRAHKISPRESFSVVVSFNLSLDVKHSRREVCHPISGAAISRSVETAKHVGDISLTLRGETLLAWGLIYSNRYYQSIRQNADNNADENFYFTVYFRIEERIPSHTSLVSCRSGLGRIIASIIYKIFSQGGLKQYPPPLLLLLRAILLVYFEECFSSFLSSSSSIRLSSPGPFHSCLYASSSICLRLDGPSRSVFQALIGLPRNEVFVRV